MKIEQFLSIIDKRINRRSIKIGSFSVLTVFIIVYLWTVFTGEGLLDRFGGVIGGDFIEFYTAGRIINEGQADRLYDVSLQRESQKAIISPQKTDRFYQYVAPPFFAYLFVPLARLSYLKAFSLWTLLSIVLFISSLLIMRQHLPGFSNRDWILTGLVCLSYIPFLVECLAGGQNSALSLFIIVLFYHLLKRQAEWWAGLVLALGLYKPQLFLLFPLLMAISGRWKTVGTFVATALLLIVISSSIIGFENIGSYLGVIFEHAGYQRDAGWKIWKMHCYNAFFRMIFGERLVLSNIFTISLSLLSLFFVLRLWVARDTEKGAIFDLKFALSVVTALLVSPYLFSYELTLLILPALLSIGAISRMSTSALSCVKLKILLSVIYIISVPSDQIAALTNLQLTVPTMLIFGWYIYLKAKQFDTHHGIGLGQRWRK